MKKCDLCETDNPVEARFCMKCGRDLDKVARSDSRDQKAAEPDTFTPLEDDEFSRLAPTKRLTREPEGDVASYKEAAAASAAAWEAEQEQDAIKERAADDRLAAAQPVQPAQPAQARQEAAPPVGRTQEVQQRDLHADFADHKRFCVRCGMANPRDQRFCKNCGSALTETAGGMADATYEAAGPVPLDVAPSSAYSGPDEQQAGRHKRPGRARSSLNRPDFGVRELLFLIAALLIATLLVWMFFFGGFTALFDAKARNIHKAGSVMQKLPGFQFGIAATFEAPQSNYPGTGHVLFETPGSSAWEIHSADPAGARTQGTLQIGAKTYSSTGTWVAADPNTSTGDVTLMWKSFSTVEALPDAPAGSSPDCLHYKYRMDPNLLMTVLGLAGQTEVSEAVMEVWMDKTSFQVMRETAQVYGALINGARTHVTFVMDLTETGKTYGIKAPGQP